MFGKYSPERKKDDADWAVGPGTYGDQQPKFGENVQCYSIAERREPGRGEPRPWTD